MGSTPGAAAGAGGLGMLPGSSPATMRGSQSPTVPASLAALWGNGMGATGTPPATSPIAGLGNAFQAFGGPTAGSTPSAAPLAPAAPATPAAAPRPKTPGQPPPQPKPMAMPQLAMPTGLSGPYGREAQALVDWQNKQAAGGDLAGYLHARDRLAALIPKAQRPRYNERGQRGSGSGYGSSGPGGVGGGRTA